MWSWCRRSCRHSPTGGGSAGAGAKPAASNLKALARAASNFGRGKSAKWGRIHLPGPLALPVALDTSLSGAQWKPNSETGQERRLESIRSTAGETRRFCVQGRRKWREERRGRCSAMRWVCQERACQWRRPAEWRRSGGQRRWKQRECAAEHPSRVRRCCRCVPQSRHGCGPGLCPCIGEPMGSQGRVGGACQPLDNRHDEACMKQKPGRTTRSQTAVGAAAL